MRGVRAAQNAASTTSLQASLLAAQTSSTAFGFLRPVEGATVTAAVVATTAVIRATAVEVATARVTTAIVAVRRRAPEVASLTGRPRPVFCNIEPQFAPTDFASVELLDCLSGVLFGGEPDEREPPGAAGFAVLWNVNVNYLADLTEELT
jgi:hypothetical protein